MKPTLPTTLLLLTLALLVARPGLAQRVLLRADPAADSVPARYGPNRAFYQHLFLGFAPVVGWPAAPGPICAIRSRASFSWACVTSGG
ncbi:hypothetical protein CDA63_01960 [Hymenobacter amundsenii]|uniref:Uncharacterized protein n=1 Tax=Hymenobacter amundsenii TaxID=2006685 RepID=A0A246FQX8_9BACT|nr:hypothetical protein [Hymenobacter amundsenii]OWP65142.1 hypothetical protein CDA63_01960 [Hymenobacter amundsenii]